MRVSKMISRPARLAIFLTAAVLSVTSAPAWAQGPTIDVWYGSVQDFGTVGEPQVWCDVLGNVSDPDGIGALSYTLNGGISVPMGVGPDGKRLENDGDFIVDLAVADLLSGANTVVISAEDGLGNPSSTIVTVNYTPGNTWPLPYATDWGSLTTDGDRDTPDAEILDQAHVVSGKWSVAGDSLRIVEPGFDRLVALGDIGWTDYEITVPVTMYQSGESFYGVGLKVRWEGHTSGTPVQPVSNNSQIGELGWLRSDGSLQLYYNSDSTPFASSLDTTYWLKMRVKTSAGQVTYAMKAWEDGQSEPVAWMVSATDGANDPATGSLMLVAHQVEAAFGDVTVTEVANTPPVAVDDAASVVIGAGTGIDVAANDYDPDGTLAPGTVTVTSGPYHGTITGVDPGTGVVTYLHDGGVAVADSFTYTIEDTESAVSNEATVRVTIIEAPPTGFMSDDFNTCGLSDFWTFVDPQGDATAPSIDGAFTGDASVAITVPTGAAHEMYTSGLQAPYIHQDASDDDFSLVVKWASALPATSFAEQGIVVLGANGRWMRLEFYSTDSDQLNILAGHYDTSFAFSYTPASTGLPAGTSPIYMRLTRVGDDWTQEYSTNGTDWTTKSTFSFAMTMTGIGLYAGNAGTNPEHTVMVDYFSNAADPVVASDDTGQNAPAITLVGSGSVTRSPDLPSYACGDPVQLTAVPDPGWTFAGWSGDTVTTDNPIDVVMDLSWDLTATFEEIPGDVVAANTSGVAGLSTTMTCATGVPIEITRSSADPVKGVSVTVDLVGLIPCGGVAGFTEGSYLNALGLTDFTVTDNMDGSWQVDVVIQNGQPCGATAATGTLFTVDLTNSIADGTGLVSVTGVSLWDCSDQALAVVAGPDAPVLVDTTPPLSVEGLMADRLLTSNPPGNILRTRTSWTGVPSADTAEVLVYRKQFGIYPEYDDFGGTTPTTPVDPLAEGWGYVNSNPVTTGIVDDYMPARNHWFYCAVTRDSLGNDSTPVMAGSVLNYLLGDVSDGGAPPADGDNVVGVADLTLLGTGYGTSHGDQGYLNTLDIGPTDDMSVTGLPTTDDRIDFEDLILFSLNYQADANSGKASLPPPAPTNVLMAASSDPADVGGTYPVSLHLAGNGTLQALQIRMDWDPAVVEPVGVRGGPLLDAQGGSAFVFTPEAGTVDIALAGARETGISGTGEVAAVTFRVVGAGDPAVEVTGLTGRDLENDPVDVTIGLVSDTPGGMVPTVSALRGNYPNPFNPTTTIAFDLARDERVRIAIYTVDGRLVRELVEGRYTAGRHEEVWDGRDGGGRTVASGTYLYVMQAGDLRETRRMLLVK